MPAAAPQDHARRHLASEREYAARARDELRKNIDPVKKHRRVEVGPFATFYFENYDTMWLQVQEMLHIEKGGSEQIAGELEAYNPLIPQGAELIATLMLEIEDADRRNAILLTLGGIEETVFMEIGERRASRPRPPNMTTAPRRTARPPRCIGCASSSRRTRSRASRHGAGSARHRPQELRPHGGVERRSPRRPGQGFRLEFDPVLNDVGITRRCQIFVAPGLGIEPVERIGDGGRIEAFLHQIHLALLEGAGDFHFAAAAAGRPAAHRRAAGLQPRRQRRR